MPASPSPSPAPNHQAQDAFPLFDPNHDYDHDHGHGHDHADTQIPRRRSSDAEGTLADDGAEEEIDRNRLYVRTSFEQGPDHLHVSAGQHGLSPMSPSEQRQQSQQIDDELELLRAEDAVEKHELEKESMSRTKSALHQTRSRTKAEPEDEFDLGTTPLHEQTKVYHPPARPTTKLAKLFIRIHQSSFLVRYFCYIIPVSLIILIPLLLGAFRFKDRAVGGVALMWFSIWLEIVWLTLWLGRIIAKCIPYPMGVVASLFTNNDKMWRDLGKQLEVPISLFFWWLAVEISFLPTMKNHHVNGNKDTKSWESTMNKIIVSILVGATLNFIEKIIIQLIAISFHLRTYADRIEINKFQTQSLVKLYIYSKEKITMKDSDFESPSAEPISGARTPMKYINKAGKGARQALNTVGDVAGKVAGDFTGRAVAKSTHPQQVVLQLLSSTSGSQVLARRLYRTFTPPDAETVAVEDLSPAFDNNEEADAAFSMFDKDMNGDISMEELEAVCVEIGRERKAITASLKDLDSVVSKLDNLFLFIVAIITILVFISLISTSAAGVLTSAGSAVLALSWLFSLTAQEILQSIVFVFIKHPFDVGDRVTIYGNTGTQGLGDDYFVKEISLLFTEFKKMEGHVVQAPNSYLNTLFILNQRRSGGLAEAVPVVMKFGTTLEQLEGLRNKLLDFVGSENREYQHNILTELKQVFEAYSISMNVVFFYKSNWQNELLRLQRRNKFICALMVSMQELGIEGPRRTWAGQNPDAPVYMATNHSCMPPVVNANGQTAPPTPIGGVAGPGPRTGSLARDGSLPGSPNLDHELQKQASILRPRGNTYGRNRNESLSQMSKRVDFSLGMSSISSSADMGDVYDKPKPKIPQIRNTSPSPPPRPSHEHDADDASLAHTTSRDSAMTAGSRSRTNKFFNRSKSKLFGAHGSHHLDDIEAGGEGHHAVQMQAVSREPQHLADIPEVIGPSRRGTIERTVERTATTTSRSRAPGSAGKGGIVRVGTASSLNPRSSGLVGGGNGHGHEHANDQAADDAEIRRIELGKKASVASHHARKG